MKRDRETGRSRSEAALEALSEGALPGTLLRLAGPSTVALLTTALYNLVDSFWVARLGATSMGALTLSFPYLMALSALGSGLGLGLSSVAARSLGAARDRSPEAREAADRTAGQIMPLSLAVGLLFALPALLLTTRLLTVLGATAATLPEGSAYLRIVGASAPFFAFTALSSNLLRGGGDTTGPMGVMIGGALGNALLDPLLIFGWGPLPPWGVSGAALATGLSQALSALVLFVWILRGHSVFAPKTAHWRPHGPSLRAIATVGVPSVIVPVLLAAVILLQNRILADWGEATLGSFGILFRLSTLLAMPIFGLCQGLLPLLSYAWGQGRRRRFRSALAWALAISFGLGLGWGLLLHGAAPSVIELFDPGPQLAAVALEALPIFVLGFPFLGPQLILMTASQGRNRAPRALAFVLVKSFVILLPLFLTLPRHMGREGFWWAQAAAELLGLLLALPWMGHVAIRVGKGQEEEIARSEGATVG